MFNDPPTYNIRKEFDKGLYVERQAELDIAQEWRTSTRRVLTITSPPANGKTWFLTHFQLVLKDDGQLVFKIDVRDFLTEDSLGMREIDPKAMNAWMVTFGADLRKDCASAPTPNGDAEIAAVLNNLAGHISTECWPGQILYLFVDGCDEPSDTSWKIIEKQILVPILAHRNWRLIIALRQSQRLHSLLLRQTEKPLVLLPLNPPQNEKKHPGHIQLQKLIKQSRHLTPPLADILAMLPDYNWIHPGLNHFLFLEACHNYTNHQKVTVQDGFLERGISALTPLSDTQQILTWLKIISKQPDEWRIEELADILGQSRIASWQIIKTLQDHLLITNIDNRYRITDGVREFIYAAQELIKVKETRI